MAYQVPKTNHPWRRYHDRVHDDGDLKVKVEKKIKPLKIVVMEFVESWDTMEVITVVNGREGRFRISELSQSKQAAWLTSYLKRHYA